MLKILIILFSLNCYALIIDEQLDNPILEDEAQKIFHDIKCLVCNGQAISDSEASTAKDLRIFIRKELSKGKSQKEIKDFLSSRYGDYIVLTPKLELDTYILWLSPLIILFFIGKIIKMKFSN